MTDGRTHRVAVIGYLVRDGRFLLLKRTTPPRVWAPPGGRLEPDEDPLAGLRREVREETGLSVEILAPVETWFGRLTGERPMLSVNYLCRPGEGAVRRRGRGFSAAGRVAPPAAAAHALRRRAARGARHRP